MDNKIKANQIINMKINSNKIETHINSIKNNEYSKRYEDFSNDVLKADFNTLSVSDLQTMYSDGASLLDEYYLICNGIECDKAIIMKMHYAMNQLSYYINIGITNELTAEFERQKIINDKLTNTANKANNNIKNTKRQLESIITTTISIILTISVITSCIAGIEKVDANYILPFLSTVFLFGVIMIAFTYSLYKNQLKTRNVVIIIFAIIFTIVAWILSFKMNIAKNNNANVNIYMNETF